MYLPQVYFLCKKMCMCVCVCLVGGMTDERAEQPRGGGCMGKDSPSHTREFLHLGIQSKWSHTLSGFVGILSIQKSIGNIYKLTEYVSFSRWGNKAIFAFWGLKVMWCIILVEFVGILSIQKSIGQEIHVHRTCVFLKWPAWELSDRTGKGVGGGSPLQLGSSPLGEPREGSS